jgi:hypothetical protein
MTPSRQGSFIRKTKDIAIGGTLALALLSGGVALQGCGGSSTETTYEDQTRYGKGVRTYISEISPGEFRITDEVSVPADNSRAIVRYYDGHRDTLTLAASKALIDREVVNNPSYHTQHHSGLGSALLWGGIGYFIGRQSNNQVYQQYYNREQDRSRFYSNPATYARANRVHDEVRSSASTHRVKVTRPSSGRSGFFSRSRSNGFGG